VRPAAREGVVFAGLARFLILNNIYIIERSLEVKLPTIWTDEKAEMGRVSEEKGRRKKIKKEKVSEERRSRCGAR
jgi:hypothetical protein